jgi:hypothetical protein
MEFKLRAANHPLRIRRLIACFQGKSEDCLASPEHGQRASDETKEWSDGLQAPTTTPGPRQAIRKEKSSDRKTV